MVETVPATTPFERPPVVSLSAVVRTYRRTGRPVEALRGVDLRVEQGELVVLMGPSGCGKTTLLHILGGLDRADAGEVNVAGVDLASASQSELDRYRRRHVGVMLQNDNLLSSATAREQVALQLLARGHGWKPALGLSDGLLAQVGLADRLHHRPDSLSGGEQQRVALARALAGGPELVLADEPTGELDSDTTREVLALVTDIHRRLACTFVIATHDPQLAQAATRVVHMSDGRVIES